MGIESSDLLLVGPELSMACLATVVILADLWLRGSRWVLVLTMLGLLMPFIAGIAIWNEVHSNGAQDAFGDSLIVDKFALFFKFLILGIVSLVLLAGAEYAQRFKPYQAEFIG